MIIFSQTGVPQCCGQDMASGVSLRGDAIATCAKCNQSYEIGSFRHNPAERRPQLQFGFNPFGVPNWIVKDGEVTWT